MSKASSSNTRKKVHFDDSCDPKPDSQYLYDLIKDGTPESFIKAYEDKFPCSIPTLDFYELIKVSIHWERIEILEFLIPRGMIFMDEMEAIAELFLKKNELSLFYSLIYKQSPLIQKNLLKRCIKNAEGLCCLAIVQMAIEAGVDFTLFDEKIIRNITTNATRNGCTDIIENLKNFNLADASISWSI